MIPISETAEGAGFTVRAFPPVKKNWITADPSLRSG